MLTPHTVHYGLADGILAACQYVLNQAFEAHPERFKSVTPSLTQLPKEVWINPPTQTQKENPCHSE